jgi:hypothetical protein
MNILYPVSVIPVRHTQANRPPHYACRGRGDARILKGGRFPLNPGFSRSISKIFFCSGFPLSISKISPKRGSFGAYPDPLATPLGGFVIWS